MSEYLFNVLLAWLVIASYLFGLEKLFDFRKSCQSTKKDRIKAVVVFIFSPIVIPVSCVVNFIRWINHG